MSNQANSSEKMMLNIIKQFSSTCRRYTEVMALKNQLQCHMFSGTPDVTAQLTPLIISLQTAAVRLQNIEVFTL